MCQLHELSSPRNHGCEVEINIYFPGFLDQQFFVLPNQRAELLKLVKVYLNSRLQVSAELMVLEHETSNEIPETVENIVRMHF